MNPRWIALLCAVGAALLLAACGGAQPSPVTQAQPSDTPQPTVDVAAIQTAAAAAIPTAIAVAHASACHPRAGRRAYGGLYARPAQHALRAVGPARVRGCLAFDNSRPVRKFNLEITLTNNAGMAIDDWYPDFYANNGALLLTCFYVYGGGFPSVPPGESREVTLTTFCEPEEYVAEMKVKINDQEIKRCFSPEGAVVACP